MGLSAGVGKLGAFVGVFLVPALQDRFGLRPMLAMAAVAAFARIFLTRLLPEAARRALERGRFAHDGSLSSWPPERSDNL